MSSPDPFAPIPLFSYPLFSSVLAGYDQRKDALVKHILAHRERYPGIKRSNRGAWHSGTEFSDVRNEQVAWVLDKATTFGRLALARFYQDWATSELKLANYWANVVGAGGWHAPHHHFPTHWSGVFYVSVGQIGTGAEDQSGMIEFVHPNPTHSLWGRGGNFAYGPKDGLLLMFPASLLHFVHPHQGEDPRITIAYNFNVVAKP